MRDINKYTEEYIKSDFEEYLVAYRRKKVLEVLNMVSHRRILEIGCGMEPLFKYIPEEQFEEYTVVEPSVSFGRNAMHEAKTSKIICINDFFKANDELSQRAYDFIICSGLLHEVEEPDKMIRDIFRLCGRETIVHINVPNANSIHRLVAKKMEIIKDVHDLSMRNKNLQQSRVFDSNSLSDIIKQEGGIVLEEGGYFVKPFTHSQMHRMIEENIIDLRVLEGLYELGKDMAEFASEIYVNVRKA